MGYVPVEERMRLVSGEFSCAGIGTWCFNQAGRLYYSTSANEKELLPLFRLGVFDQIRQDELHCQQPILFSDELNLMWCAENAAVKDSTLLIVFGPVCYSRVTLKSLEERLRNMNLSIAIKSPLFRIFRDIPVMTTGELNQFARMLHFMLTEEFLPPESLLFHKTPKKAVPFVVTPNTDDELLSYSQTDADRLEHAEEQILQAIRDGNPEYRKILNRTGVLGGELISQTGDPLRDGKNTLIIFCALCVRAATEGGLPAGTARRLQREYIARFEACQNMNNLIEQSDAMIADLVGSVRRATADPCISDKVRSCCDYIHAHLKEPLSAEILAQKLGYSSYYFTKKFYKETGTKMTDYINQARIEYAKIELITTRRSIQEISDDLQFGTRNYFGKIFQSLVGMTPVQYRNRGKARQEPSDS